MTDHSELTDRQREIRDAIGRLTAVHGCPPTVWELMDAFEIKSPQGIQCHLRALKRKGAIAWTPTKARTLRVVEQREESSC
jgi:repressor LexA